MADFYEQLANYLVFPTEQDHHGESATGSGRIATELMFCAVADIMSGRGNYIVTGFTCPPETSSVTDAPVGSGSAWIDGHYIVGNDNILVDLTPSESNYLYLKLEYTGDYVERPLIEVNTTGTTPAHCAFIGKVVCDATQVTSVSPWRSGPRLAYGIVSVQNGNVLSYDVRGGRSWTVDGVGGDVYGLTFDSGSFLNKPCAIFQVINDTYPAVVRVIDGGSNDDIHFVIYHDIGAGLVSTGTGTVSFIICG